MKRMIFEMETADPDDFMTLLWLADHPDVELLGVLVTPGSERSVPAGPLGAGSLRAAGGPDRRPARPSVVGDERGQEGAGLRLPPGVLRPRHPGAPRRRGRGRPRAAGRAAPRPGRHGARRGRAQEHRQGVQGRSPGSGSLAGSSKAASRATTWSPSRSRSSAGASPARASTPAARREETLALLASPQIGERRFVSKNVCHGSSTPRPCARR